MNSSSIINRIWRIIITGFGFSLFGLGAILLSTLWFSLIRFIIWQPEKRSQITQDSIRWSFRLFITTMRFLGVFDYQFIGIEKLSTDDGCIVVANHPSLLDYVFIASIMPRCDCIVKEALFHNPFVRGVIKAAGYIPNCEAEKLLPMCQERLNNHGILLIFPEGTRTTPGQMLSLQRGAANIALRCNANIRIISIHCHPPMLTKEKRWYQIPAIKPFFKISVEQKLYVHHYLSSQSLSLAVPARRLTHDLSELFNHYQREH